MASLSAMSSRIDPGTPRPSPLSANFGLRWDVDNWGDQEPDQERLASVKRLNDECRLKAIKEKAEAKGAKDARRASELNRRQAESGALVEALSVIRTLVDGRAEKPTKEITLEPDSQSEPDEGSDIADST